MLYYVISCYVTIYCILIYSHCIAFYHTGYKGNKEEREERRKERKKEGRKERRKERRKEGRNLVIRNYVSLYTFCSFPRNLYLFYN